MSAPAWTAREDAFLRKAFSDGRHPSIAKQGMPTWAQMAVEMRTGRSADALSARWHRYLKPTKPPGRRDEEAEDSDDSDDDDDGESMSCASLPRVQNQRSSSYKPLYSALPWSVTHTQRLLSAGKTLPWRVAASWKPIASELRRSVDGCRRKFVAAGGVKFLGKIPPPPTSPSRSSGNQQISSRTPQNSTLSLQNSSRSAVQASWSSLHSGTSTGGNSFRIPNGGPVVGSLSGNTPSTPIGPSPRTATSTARIQGQGQISAQTTRSDAPTSLFARHHNAPALPPVAPIIGGSAEQVESSSRAAIAAARARIQGLQGSPAPAVIRPLTEILKEREEWERQRSAAIAQARAKAQQEVEEQFEARRRLLRKEVTAAIATDDFFRT